MGRGTNESLGFHITENSNTVQNQRRDRKHIENSQKPSLKVDDDRNSYIGDNNAVNSFTQIAEGVVSTHP